MDQNLILPRPVRLKEPKQCKCGALYYRIPTGARLSVDVELGGFYWECECRSTLFAPRSLNFQRLAEDAARRRVA
jgi:hypothetical protein